MAARKNGQTKRREDLLLESAELMEMIISRLPVSYMIHQDGQIVYANQALLNFIGGSWPEIEGRSIFDFLTAESKALVAKNMARRLAGESIEDYEVDIETVSKGRTSAIVRAVAIQYQGAPATLVVLFDITGRKIAEEAIRSNEERLKILFDHAPDAYYLNDLKGTFVDGNLAAEKILGYPKNELIGKSFFKLKLLSPSFLGKAAKLIAKNVLGRATGPDEFVLNRKDGTHVVVEIRTHPVKIKGRTLVLGIARDITKRKQAEERGKALEAELRRQEKIASISTLAGGVAHEINNPLNGIMNYAQLILDNPDKAGQTGEYAAEIIREVKSAANIVRSLLAFSRPMSEGRSEISPAEIVGGVASAVEADLRAKNIAFEVDAPAGLPGVLCNMPQIQQVLLNLVLNAQEALAERSAGRDENKRIRIIGRGILLDGRRFVRMSVEDNGPGIPKSVQKRLFDPFFTTKSRALHTGLGLALSRRIVEEQGGRLWVESEPGKFARFHLDLPSSADQGG